MIAESVVPFVEERLDRAVEKYGYLPEMWNPYNNAEITDKAPTLTTAANHTSSSTVLTYEPVNATADGKSWVLKGQYYKNGMANFLNNNEKGSNYSASGVAEPVPIGAYPIEFDGNVPTKAISQADGKTYRVHKVENGIINIKGKDYPIKLADGYYIIRKLTVRECMRLQTIPEWYEFPASDAQAYKQIGNGWTCEVITHLIKSCLAGKVDDFAEQIKFF
jgi:site-specific DNA-cytosine methylase